MKVFIVTNWTINRFFQKTLTTMGAAEKFLTEAEKSPQGRSRLRYRLYQDQDCDVNANLEVWGIIMASENLDYDGESPMVM